jgi:hypothetical protein
MLAISFMAIARASEPAWEHEPAATQRLAEKYKAEAEVQCPNGDRCDLVNATEAIEVEWCGHWHEAIGQSVEYAMELNKAPAIVLLVRDPAKDAKQIARCGKVCAKLGIHLYTERAQKP